MPTCRKAFQNRSLVVPPIAYHAGHAAVNVNASRFTLPGIFLRSAERQLDKQCRADGKHGLDIPSGKQNACRASYTTASTSQECGFPQGVFSMRRMYFAVSPKCVVLCADKKQLAADILDSINSSSVIACAASESSNSLREATILPVRLTPPRSYANSQSRHKMAYRAGACLVGKERFALDRPFPCSRPFLPCMKPCHTKSLGVIAMVREISPNTEAAVRRACPSLMPRTPILRCRANVEPCNRFFDSLKR